MPTISRQAAHPRLATFPGRDNQLAIEVRVNDDKVGQEAHGFDGMEQAFVLLPPAKKGMEWERHNLNYGGVDSFGSSGAKEDYHWLRLVVDDKTRAAVKEQGVAFGLDTNVGQLWLQEADNNVKS